MMNRPVRLVACCFSAGAILFSGCSKKEANKPVELKVKWTPGMIYVNEVTMDQNAMTQAPNLPSGMHQATTTAEQYSVTPGPRDADGTTHLVLNFLKRQAETKVGDVQMMSFDSSKDPSQDAKNPLAPAFRKLLNVPIKVTADANGKVTKVEGAQELARSVAQGLAQQFQGALRNSMSDDNIKQLFATSEAMPDHPVNPGDTWPVEMAVPAAQLGNLVVKLTYTFKNWEEKDGHKCVALDYTGEITKGNSPATQGLTLDIDKGSIQGRLWFDPELGAMILNTNHQAMSMKISMQSKTLTSELDQNSTMRLVELKTAR